MQSRFKEILDKKKLNSQQIAKLIGVDSSTVSLFLSGKRRPSFDVLMKLSAAIPDINMNWLLTGNGHMLSTETISESNFEYTPNINFEQEDNKAMNTNTYQEATDGKEEEKIKIPDNDSLRQEYVNNNKKIKKIILIYNDDSFEVFGI